MPSADVAETARAAIRYEWRSLVVRRRRRHRIVQFGAAAAILLGLFAAFNLLRAPALPAVQVASIDKSFGSVYVLGEQAELRQTGDLAAIMAGQTIVTGPDAGLAVAWGGGGSLRVDQNTRLEFTDNNSVFLQEGRVYFDSCGASLAASTRTGDAPVLRRHAVHGAG